MAHCPQCGTEYRESTLECADCRTPLEPGPPPDIEEVVMGGKEPKLVRLRVFSGPTSLMQADLARNLLATEGIPCVLPGQVMGEILPGVEPIQMLVDERDAARADAILQAYLENPQIEPAE